MTIGNRLPSLRANIVAMTVVQFSNYILPLVALPYLARVLGPEAFGKVVLAQVVMTYFVLLVDYGFSWSATRKIAVLRTDRVRLSRLFMATWTAQWLLVLLAFALATSIVMSNDRLRLDAPLYAAAFAVVIGTPLAPFWFLQGLERLQAVAALQLITRTLALLPIFVLVKQPGDAIWVLITQASGTILGGALALIWIYREAIIIWHTPTWHETLHELADGWTLFRSRAAISLYTSLVPLVLGWVAGPVALAHFNMADKLRSAAQSLLTPLSQALFPRMSHLVSTDSNAADSLIRRSAVAVMYIAGTASATLWLFADHLIHFLGGQDFLPASDVLRWLSPPL